MKKYILIGVCAAFITALGACKKFLDVVPDNVPTIDNAFSMRTQAEKFLFTCYSYMPRDADANQNPALSAGDEIWRIFKSGGEMFNIAMGLQNIVEPYGNDYYNSLYRGLRDCNIFLENIERVPDLSVTEKTQWVAEVKFLKAYYHFYLLRMYGPIPLIKKNQPIDADIDAVKVARSPIDSCISYITQLIDEARPDLPATITDRYRLGHITQPIALSFKAKVLVTAASPLFNGNTDQARMKNLDGTVLFNQVYDPRKWDLAVDACEEAIDACTQTGMKLYKFEQGLQSLSDTIRTQLSIRNSVTENFNTEIIWANTQSYATTIQQMANQRTLDPAYPDNNASYTALAPPLKIAEMFYSNNGVPINEDKDWNYNKRYELSIGTTKDRLYIWKDYLTANLNFNREPRFYADLGFDGGVWYGQGKYSDKGNLDLLYIKGKKKQVHGVIDVNYGPVTGYLVKKLVHYQNVSGAGAQYSVNAYAWPLLRLSDLYLLYAEALNEAQGPGPKAYEYANMVRTRAGLKSIEESWLAHSTNPSKYTTKEGFREIIHQERLIELAFEGHRFWDLRRWKESLKVLNAPITGWDISQETSEAYYRSSVIFNQSFSTKDYFWPIKDVNITVNRNTVQSLGW